MEHLGRMGFSEEQASLLAVASDFCRQKSPMEKVRALIEDARGFDEGLWREIADLGWLGIAIPEMYGGAGLGLGEATPVMEQMGRRMMASPFASTTIAAQAILAGGKDSQKQSLLPAIASGAIAAIALSEGCSDWDFENIKARAHPVGAGYRLSGVKHFVSYAEAAQWILALVVLDSAPVFAIIERTELGDNALRRETIIDETRRTYEVTLDGVEIETSALLDQEKTRATLSHIHRAANLLAAAELCGAIAAALDLTIDYLNTRKQFGKPIGSYQGLKHPTVDAYTAYEQARSHLYSAANCANEQGTGEIAIRMAKTAALAACNKASAQAIQFHGAFGFTYECDAQLYRRCAIWHRSQFGDANFHTKKLAALLLDES